MTEPKRGKGRPPKPKHELYKLVSLRFPPHIAEKLKRLAEARSSAKGSLVSQAAVASDLIAKARR